MGDYLNLHPLSPWRHGRRGHSCCAALLCSRLLLLRRHLGHLNRDGSHARSLMLRWLQLLVVMRLLLLEES